MGFSIRETQSTQDFSESIKNINVPILVLDQKWHHIFAGTKKPEHIQSQEKRVGELLAAQGRAQQDLKDLKKLKATLMQNIVNNMEGAEGKSETSTKKLSESGRFIDEVNEKIAACEDTLLDLPGLLKEANDELMQSTMTYCYDLLRINAVNIKEIGSWIKDIRIELKKQIIRKQDAESKNKEIYAYMHDIFGPQAIDVFDLKYESDEDESGKEKKKKKKKKKP